MLKLQPKKPKESAIALQWDGSMESMKSISRTLEDKGWNNRITYDLSTDEFEFEDYYKGPKKGEYVVIPLDKDGELDEDEDLEFLSETELKKRFSIIE